VQPCGSFDYAYREAVPDDVIEVGGGHYPAQVVRSLGRGAPVVELRPADGAEVTVHGIDIDADHIVLRGMKSTSWLDVGNGVDVIQDVTLVDNTAQSAYLNNGRDVTYRGGSVGGKVDKRVRIVATDGAGPRLVRGLGLLRMRW
jgi:hypothetical protein